MLDLPRDDARAPATRLRIDRGWSRRWLALAIAPSGLRSSWPSIARNSSLARLAASAAVRASRSRRRSSSRSASCCARSAAAAASALPTSRISKIGVEGGTTASRRPRACAAALSQAIGAVMPRAMASAESTPSAIDRIIPPPYTRASASRRLRPRRAGSDRHRPAGLARAAERGVNLLALQHETHAGPFVAVLHEPFQAGRGRLVEEFGVLARARHPHVVRVEHRYDPVRRNALAVENLEESFRPQRRRQYVAHLAFAQHRDAHRDGENRGATLGEAADGRTAREHHLFQALRVDHGGERRAVGLVRVGELLALRIGQRDRDPVGAAGVQAPHNLVEALEISGVERRPLREGLQRGNRAMQLRVDRRGERARDLDPGALGLGLLLGGAREQRDARGRRERHDARRREQEQPSPQRLHQRRAYFRRKALISSIRSCGSPGTGCEPTTRFIHSMFSCMRATTLGHSSAVWRLGSGSTWHWLHAEPEGLARGPVDLGIALRIEGRLRVLLQVGDDRAGLLLERRLHARHHLGHERPHVARGPPCAPPCGRRPPATSRRDASRDWRGCGTARSSAA